MNKEEIKVEKVEVETEKVEGADLVATKPPFASRILAALCQLGAILFIYCVFPAIAMLALRKGKNPFVFEHAKLAMVTQLVMFFAMTGYHCFVATLPIIGNMLLVIAFAMGIGQFVAAAGALAGMDARQLCPTLFREKKEA